MLKAIEYIYRFDPENPNQKRSPQDAEAARQALEQGNRMFSNWMHSCQGGNGSTGGEPPFVLNCNALEVGLVRGTNELPRQEPFALVVGCSDARVPPEMIFGQGFNSLFVIRVAGNILGEFGKGSVDFAVHAQGASVKVLVVLGHSCCGAVTGAVDAYLDPLCFWSRPVPTNLRAILQRIFVPVHEAARALEEVWGADAARQPRYREALIETAVYLNAAQNGYDLRQEMEQAGRGQLSVLVGIYNLHNHQVTMPSSSSKAARAVATPLGGDEIRLVEAPSSPGELDELALCLARRLKPMV